MTGIGYKLYHYIRGENPHHLHKIENRIYYYDDMNKYVGYYDCQNEDCDDAESIIDDEDFYYYKEATTNVMGLFNNEYSLIKDGDKVVLQNVKLDIHINDFKAYKNYGTLIAGEFIILQNEEDKYGLFDVNNIIYRIEPLYDFMGVSDGMINMTSEGILIAVKKDMNWFLIDTYGSAISFVTTEPIYSYDENFIYTKVNNRYRVYDYDGNDLMGFVNISAIDWANDNIIITDPSGNISLYSTYFLDEPFMEVKNNGRGLKYEITDTKILFKDSNGTEIDSFELVAEEENNEEELDTEDSEFIEE